MVGVENIRRNERELILSNTLLRNKCYAHIPSQLMTTVILRLVSAADIFMVNQKRT